MAFGWAGAGGGAADALQALLVRAFAEKQAQEQMALRERELHQQAEQQAASRQMQERQLTSTEAFRTDQQANLEHERDFRRANTIASGATPGKLTGASTAGLLRKHGFEGDVIETPTQGKLLGVDEAGVDRYEVVPELRMRGGSQYLNAQAQREATAANAEATRAAAAERAASADDLRRDLARTAAGARGDAASLQTETRGLQNELTRQRIEQNQAKIDADKQWREKTGEDAQRVTQNAYDLATRLETHPGLATSQGIVSSRLTGWTQGAEDFRGIRDQLVAALTLPNLGALKGPMSDKDVKFVKDLATRLNNDRMSDAETRLAIREAKAFLESKGAVPATAGPSATTPSAADLIKKYGGR